LPLRHHDTRDTRHTTHDARNTHDTHSLFPSLGSTDSHATQAREALHNLEKESAGNAYRITILLKSIAEVEQRNAQLEAQLKEAQPH